MKLTKAQSGLEFDCQDTLEIMDLYVVFPDELTASERNDAAEHMLACKSCRDKYLQMKLTDTALRVNRNWLKEQGAFGSSEADASQVEISEKEIAGLRFENIMDRALTRRKRRERRERIAKVQRLAKPISAIAACLIIAIGIWGALKINNTAEISTQQPIAANPTKTPVKIELLTNSGTEIIQTDRPILAASRLKTLRINGNRQMVLNIGTQLSIERYDLGCVVKLDRGEIYTEVEHDGNPFVVQTSLGRAVITGTIFNIKTDCDKMDLAVVEGSVRFESEKGTVDVINGYQSSISASMQPTKPVPCDALQITKWTKEQRTVVPVQMDMPTQVDIADLAELSFVHVPYCDLENINFDVWIDQRREWFEREFPWTKRLHKLLAQDGIKVDTINLLVESGDLWRFAWPEYSRQRILTEKPQIIRKVANKHGLEVEKLTSDNTVQNRYSTSITAFERWSGEFGTEKSNLTINSIHAAVFLINTRSLAWHAVNEGHIQTQEKKQILGLCADQVKIAADMLADLNQLLLTDKGISVCSVTQYQESTKKIKGDISSLMEIERELAKHEIFSK